METTNVFLEAVKEGDQATVAQLLERDPSLVHAQSPSGLSPVLMAIYYGEAGIADLLIAKGAHLNLFEATAAGRLERVKELLAHDPTLVNAYAADGFQPLGLASFFGHKPIVDWLLGQGAEVNSASRNAQRVQPLHSAAASQHLEIARALLAQGADVNAVQEDGFTPLQEAAQNGQLGMVELCLSYGADINARNAAGHTALDLALKKGHTAVANLLRQNPA
jgi:ankyrin repeat protein